MTTEQLWERIREELETLRGEVREEISAVRVDFAAALHTEVGSVRSDLRSFRAGFDLFRDDALTHFDKIYRRLDVQASEDHALRVAVERIETTLGGA